MKRITLVASLGCILLTTMSSVQARPLNHGSHRHVVVQRNIVHKNVVVRPAPIRTSFNHLTTVRLSKLPVSFVRLAHKDISYYYVNGVYYVKEPTGYVQVRPVSGLRVASLPPGFTRVRIGPDYLYRYNNIDYRKVNGFFIVV